MSTLTQLAREIAERGRGAWRRFCDRLGQQAAAGADLRRQGGEGIRRHRAAISSKAAAAASSVRVTCSSPCASEGNQASNCEGGG